MRVLLLGGAGFIGRALAETLTRRGDRVDVAARGSFLDPLDADAVARWVEQEQVDGVVNLVGAGITRGSASLEEMERINTQQPIAVASALAELVGRVHLVHAASSTERLPGQDLDESDYSRTKHAGTVGVAEVSDRADWPVTIARLHNTYGPGQPATRFVAATVSALRAGRPIVLAHPRRVRDFVYVDDVAESLAVALDQEPGGRPDIGTGTGTALADLAHLAAQTVGAPAELVVVEHESAAPDPHLATVCAIPFGSYGLCRTSLTDGIRLMTEAP